jgi:hypothetical protein
MRSVVGERTATALDFVGRALYVCFVFTILVLTPGMSFAAKTKAPPSNVTVGVRAGEDTSDGYLDILAPVHAYKQGLVYFNPRFTLGDEGANELNVGLGVRQLVNGEKLMIGGNVYYDLRHTEYGNNFNQFGAGIEFFSKWVDGRANYYKPEDKIEKIASVETETVDVAVSQSSRTSTSYGDPYAIKHRIDQDVTRTTATTTTTRTTTTRQLFEMFESGRTGWDAELGVLLPLQKMGKKAPEIRIFGGYYGFEDEFDQKVEGAKARIEVRATSWLKLDGAAFEDKDLNETTYFVGARLETPVRWGGLFKGKGKGAFPKGRQETFVSSMRPRMTEMVMRDARIQTDEGDETTVTVDEQEDTKLSVKTRTTPVPLMTDINFVDCDEKTMKKAKKGATQGEAGEELTADAGVGVEGEAGAELGGEPAAGIEGEEVAELGAEAADDVCTSNCPGTGDGSADNPFVTVTDAVEDGRKNIWIMPGFYHENVELNRGQNIYSHNWILTGQGGKTFGGTSDAVWVDGTERGSPTIQVEGNNGIYGLEISNMRNREPSHPDCGTGECPEPEYGGIWGRAIGGHDINGKIVIQDNYIHDSRGIVLRTGFGGEAVQAANGGNGKSDILIQGNYFEYNENQAVRVEAGWDTDTNVVVADNTIVGLMGDGFLGGDQAAATDVDASFFGIEPRDIGAFGILTISEPYAQMNVDIRNNFLFDIYGVGIGNFNYAGHQDATVKNNRVGFADIGYLAVNVGERAFGPNGDVQAQEADILDLSTMDVLLAGNEFGTVITEDDPVGVGSLGQVEASDEVEGWTAPVLAGAVAVNMDYYNGYEPPEEECGGCHATLNIEARDNSFRSILLGSANLNVTESEPVEPINAANGGPLTGAHLISNYFSNDYEVFDVGHLDANVGIGQLDSTFAFNDVNAGLLGYGAVNLDVENLYYGFFPNPELPDIGGGLPFGSVGDVLALGQGVVAGDLFGLGDTVLPDVGIQQAPENFGPGTLNTEIMGNYFGSDYDNINLAGIVVANLGRGTVNSHVEGNVIETEALGLLNLNLTMDQEIPNGIPVDVTAANDIMGGTFNSTYEGNCSGCHMVGVADINIGNGTLNSTLQRSETDWDDYWNGRMDVDYFDLDGGNLIYGWDSEIGPGIAAYLGVNYGNYGTLNSSITDSTLIGDILGAGFFNIGNGILESSFGGPVVEEPDSMASDLVSETGGNYVYADIGYLGVNWGYAGVFDAGGSDMGPTPVAADDPVYSTGINNNVFDTGWMGIAAINYGGEAFPVFNVAGPNGFPMGGGYMSISAADNEINSYGTMVAGAGDDVGASWYYDFFDLSTGLAAANIGDGFVDASFTGNDVYGADLGIFFKNFNFSPSMVPYVVETSFLPGTIGMNASASGNTISSPWLGGILAETYTDWNGFFLLGDGVTASLAPPVMADFTLAVDDNTITDVWGGIAPDAAVVNPPTFGIGFSSMSRNDMQQELFDMGSSYLLDGNVGMADVTITGNDILSTNTPEFGIAVEARDRSMVNGLLVHDNTVSGATNAGIGLYTFNQAMMNNAVVTDNTVSNARTGMMFKTGNRSEMNDLRVGGLGEAGNTVTGFQTGMQFNTSLDSEMQRLFVQGNTVSNGGTGMAFNAKDSSKLGAGVANRTVISSNEIFNVGFGIDFHASGEAGRPFGDGYANALYIDVMTNNLHDITNGGGAGAASGFWNDSAAMHFQASNQAAIVPRVTAGNTITNSDYGIVMNVWDRGRVGFAFYPRGGPAEITGNTIETLNQAIILDTSGNAELNALVQSNNLDSSLSDELYVHQHSGNGMKLDVNGNTYTGTGDYDMNFMAHLSAIIIVDDDGPGPGMDPADWAQLSDRNPNPASGPDINHDANGGGFRTGAPF